MVNNFGQTKSEIAGEINRTDLDTEIGVALTSAMTMFETEKFTFNQAYSASRTMTANQRNIALPSDFFSLVSLRFVYSSNDVRALSYISPQEMDAMDNDPSFYGAPEFYSIYNNQYRFYPVPDQAYSIQESYFKVLPKPVADGDVSEWFTYAYLLIKYQAKFILYSNVLFDEALATFYKGMADLELRRLKDAYNTQNGDLNLTLRR